jgi:hypothetical protein
MGINEFARCMGIGKNLAYYLCRTGKAPVKVIHLGEKRMVLSRAEVMKLLNEEKPRA